MGFSLNKSLRLSIILITLSSINLSTYLPIGNTFFWWVIYTAILTVFFKAEKYYDADNNKNIRPVQLYLAWNIICVIRGCFVAEIYWEWKNLVGTSLVLLLPLSINITTNRLVVQKLMAYWLTYALPGFFLILPFFKYGDAIGRYLVPISFLLLFFPILPKKWKAICLFFALFVLMGDLSARSNVIKFGVPLLLSLIYYVRSVISSKILEFARIILFFVPIALLILGITGIFNVFKMDEYISGDYVTQTVVDGKETEASLTVDTRTFLYEEVIGSAIKYDYIWLGRTPARGNESASFGLTVQEELKTDKMERFANEVSILNIFTWTGLIGVILYFFIFYRASYLAINKSNSLFMRLVGLFVAFRWVYAWVEDFNNFDLSYFFLWLIIGMCFSKSFREMTDEEFKYWIYGIFEKKYRRFELGLRLPSNTYKTTNS